MTKALQILLLCAIAVAGRAQAQDQDAYRTIPPWVKTDRPTFPRETDDPHPAAPAFPQTFSANGGHEHTWFNGPGVHRGIFNAAAPAPLPAAVRESPGYAQELDASSREAYRPTVSVGNTWKLSAPNI